MTKDASRLSNHAPRFAAVLASPGRRRAPLALSVHQGVAAGRVVPWWTERARHAWRRAAPPRHEAVGCADRPLREPGRSRRVAPRARESEALPVTQARDRRERAQRAPGPEPAEGFRCLDTLNRVPEHGPTARWCSDTDHPVGPFLPADRPNPGGPKGRECRGLSGFLNHLSGHRRPPRPCL